MICSWLDLRIQNSRYGGLIVKLYVELRLHEGPLCCSRVNCITPLTGIVHLQALCTYRHCNLSFLLISYCLSICFLISNNQLFLTPAVSHSAGNGELLSKAAVPNLFSTRDWFRGRQLFHGPGWGWESSALHLSCTLFLLLLHCNI